MASDIDVLVIGDYYLDLVFADAPAWPQSGTEVFANSFAMVPGGSFTHALALGRLGVRTRWSARFGSDACSAHVLRAAEEEGLDPTLFSTSDEPIRNISVSISRAGDRGFISYREAVSGPAPERSVLDVRPRVVLLPHLMSGPSSTRILDAATTVGAHVFMDCQHTEADLETSGVRETLARTAVFAPNAAEARQLTGLADLTAAAAAMSELGPTVLVKNGAGGAIAADRGRTVEVAGVPVAVMDTTGAGDCFDAGFLYAQLRGYDLTDSVRIAVACGALSTTAAGNTAAPTRARLDAFLAENPDDQEARA